MISHPRAAVADLFGDSPAINADGPRVAPVPDAGQGVSTPSDDYLTETGMLHGLQPVFQIEVISGDPAVNGMFFRTGWEPTLDKIRREMSAAPGVYVMVHLARWEQA